MNIFCVDSTLVWQLLKTTILGSKKRSVRSSTRLNKTTTPKSVLILPGMTTDLERFPLIGSFVLFIDLKAIRGSVCRNGGQYYRIIHNIHKDYVYFLNQYENCLKIRGLNHSTYEILQRFYCI